MILANIQSF